MKWALYLQATTAGLWSFLLDVELLRFLACSLSQFLHVELFAVQCFSLPVVRDTGWVMRFWFIDLKFYSIKWPRVFRHLINAKASDLVSPFSIYFSAVRLLSEFPSWTVWVSVLVNKLDLDFKRIYFEIKIFYIKETLHYLGVNLQTSITVGAA